MPNMGGLGFSQVAVLAAGFSSDDWPDQFGVIPGTKSFEERGRDKGVLRFDHTRIRKSGTAPVTGKMITTTFPC